MTRNSERIVQKNSNKNNGESKKRGEWGKKNKKLSGKFGDEFDSKEEVGDEPERDFFEARNRVQVGIEKKSGAGIGDGAGPRASEALRKGFRGG